MTEKDITKNMEQFLKRPIKREDIRITTYLESELHDEIMTLKRAGISIKKLINEAVAELLNKYEII